jgi:hypothetical protein
MSTKSDLREALELLEAVNDYGVRLSMGDNWCRRIDVLLGQSDGSGATDAGGDADEED